ncbi:hypothetical protein SAZ10_17355 [Mesorhizobium sp. BAC0120]|nr:hypothetical protein [Mesorhizobium sp. BAC0120]MDW6023520.1 hypothetical protein [Mesorhizobium sp. BAC0120]
MVPIVQDAETGEHCFDGLRVDPDPAEPVGLASNGQVLLDRHVRPDVRLLMNDRNAPPDLVDLTTGRRQNYLAAVGLFLACQHAHQRAFAGAVRSGYADNLAGAKLHRETIKGARCAISLGNAAAAQLDHALPSEPRRAAR